MSMYNMLFGVHGGAGFLIKFAGLKLEEIPRFRDAWIDTKQGQYIICIYTRTGGGNRHCYCDDYDSEKKERNEVGHLSGCLPYMNQQLVRKSNYITDYDDDFDCTYATFEFRALPEYVDLVTKMAGMQDKKYEKSPSDRFQETLKAMQAMSKEDLEKEYPQVVEMFKTIASMVEDKKPEEAMR